MELRTIFEKQHEYILKEIKKAQNGYIRRNKLGILIIERMKAKILEIENILSLFGLKIKRENFNSNDLSFYSDGAFTDIISHFAESFDGIPDYSESTEVLIEAMFSIKDFTNWSDSKFMNWVNKFYYELDNKLDLWEQHGDISFLINENKYKADSLSTESIIKTLDEGLNELKELKVNQQENQSQINELKVQVAAMLKQDDINDVLKLNEEKNKISKFFESFATLGLKAMTTISLATLEFYSQ